MSLIKVTTSPVSTWSAGSPLKSSQIKKLSPASPENKDPFANGRISESLLNFESSIENQLQASLLLGRQINLDKARQLALVGDQEGVMKEILKAVGGEAEFNKMNVIQRKALAESVGVNVEQLSRLVRNNTAGGTAGAVGAAMGGGRSEEVTFLESIDRKIGKVAGAI